MLLTHAARLFNTVRYLKAEQLWYRLVYRMLPSPSARALPLEPRPWLRGWSAPALVQPALVGPMTFELLGKRAHIATAGDWNDPAQAKLWLYNAHYLDDLNSDGAEQRSAWIRQMVDRWIVDNPPGHGVGWEPYPLSLRLVNLVKWMSRQDPPDRTVLASVAAQAETLSRRIEYHLLGNHLFANAKALVFAGCYLAGTAPDEWLKRGLSILEGELAEQFLPDGGHFERSPMYHATLLVDLLDLLQLSDVALAPALRDRRGALLDAAVAGLHWLDAMTHPDGEIAFFNDAAIGVAPAPARIHEYARAAIGTAATVAPRRPFDLTVLRDSGYARVDLPDSGAAIVDVAPLGPDYLPAHGHADTLSFELSLYGTRVFVNSGTSLYGESDERLRQRGTRAHNTVVVNGADSSEVWGGFRVARRAHALLHKAEREPKRIVVEGSHDGYRRLPGRNTHWRRWTFAPDALFIEDTLTGRVERAEARFHLHPAVTIQQADLDARRATLRLPGGQHALFEAVGATLSVEPSTWHPRFGVSVANRCLALRFAGNQAGARLQWGSQA